MSLKKRRKSAGRLNWRRLLGGLLAACLLLMLCSRKAMYPWAISLFTLIVPILLLISNRYPC